jgi:membrane protease YdiL (CAAX protease family)
MVIVRSIKSLLFFIVHPTPSTSLTYSKRLKNLFLLFIFSFIIDFLIDNYTNSSWLFNYLKINSIELQEKDILKRGILFAIIVVGIITPMIEEFLQRAYLTNFYWNNCLIPINLSIIILLLFGISGSFMIVMMISISLIFAIIIYIILFKYKNLKIKTFQFYRKHYWIYFYISAVSFGVLHLTNYNIHHFVPVIPILLVLSQIFAGITLGFIRIKYGLKASIFFHSLHNLLGIIFLFI